MHIISRLSKTLLVAASAFYYTLVVLNNLTDYDSNYQFVHHVLLMDSTFPGNHRMWRAIQPLWIHTAFYGLIMSWEVVSMLLIWAGTVRLLRAIGQDAAFRMFLVEGIVLLVLLTPELDDHERLPNS